MRPRNIVANACLVPVLGILLASCGGSTGMPTPSPSAPVVHGEVQAEGTIKTPIVMTAGSSTFLGLAGTINKATMRDTSPSLGETEIFYVNGKEIRACAPDGTRDRSLLVHSTQIYRIWRSGERIYFRDDQGSGYSFPILGGGTLPNNMAGVLSLEHDAAGIYRAYTKSAGGIEQVFRSNANGSSETQLTTGGVDKTVMGYLGDHIVYRNLTLGPSVVTSVILPGQSPINFVSYAPEVSTFAYSFRSDPNARVMGVLRSDVPSGGRAIDLFGIQLPNHNRISTIVDPTNTMEDLAISPDAKKVVYSKGTDNLTPNQLFVSSVEADTSVRIKTGFMTASPVWGTFTETRPFIGNTGGFAGGGSAMLWSQVGPDTRCVVLADAVTRSSTTLTPETQSADSTTTAFRLSCDNLSKLYYTQDNSFKLLPLVTSATGLKGAILVFLKETGELVSAVTFNATATVTTEGGKTVISGEGLVDALKPGGREASTNRIVVGN